MKQLELQQEREERDLLERVAANANGDATTTTDSTKASAARSGNDVAFNASEGNEVRRRADYANAKSMPGSRRHSGELQAGDAVPEGRRQKGREGEGQMLNSFIFDDELDADLQSEYQSFTSSRLRWIARRSRDGWWTFETDDFFLVDSAWGGKYLQMNTDDDKFPILIRRDSYPGIVSLVTRRKCISC